MRALALLLLLAAAAAVQADHKCPPGFRQASAALRRSLRAIGLQSFLTHGQEVCNHLPALITEPDAFGIDVETVCATRSSDAAVFRVSFNSPCKGGASDTTYMTVDTTPKKCRKAYDPKLAKWGWHTTTPGNMRPLQCPAGYRKATRKDQDLLTAFLLKQFAEVEMPHRLKGKYHCQGGIQEMRFWYLNGCIQTWPKGVAPYVMAQGKIDYSCYGSHRTLKLGLDGEGTYKTLCEWKVAFDN